VSKTPRSQSLQALQAPKDLVPYRGRTRSPIECGPDHKSSSNSTVFMKNSKWARLGSCYHQAHRIIIKT